MVAGLKAEIRKNQSSAPAPERTCTNTLDITSELIEMLPEGARNNNVTGSVEDFTT